MGVPLLRRVRTRSRFCEGGEEVSVLCWVGVGVDLLVCVMREGSGLEVMMSEIVCFCFCCFFLFDSVGMVMSFDLQRKAV